MFSHEVLYTHGSIFSGEIGSTFFFFFLFSSAKLGAYNLDLSHGIPEVAPIA
jgi:hypothetical protein